MQQDNIGRVLPIKKAFIEHFGRGVDEIIPVTKALQIWQARARETRVIICADRMVDDVKKLLDKYHQVGNKQSDKGIHSPLPVMLIAFGRDMDTIDPTKGNMLANEQVVQLVKNGEYYKMRTDFVSLRVQVAFMAHESETAKAMTSQMRLYFGRFNHNRFPIQWHFGGNDFLLSGSLDDLPVSDDLADLPDRTNITCLTWNLSINAQIPYLNAPKPYQYNENGLLKGYPLLNRVDVDLNEKGRDLTNGVIDVKEPLPIFGKWTKIS